MKSQKFGLAAETKLLLGLGRMKPGKTPERVGEDYMIQVRSHEAIPTRPVSSESADDETTSVAKEL